MSRVFYLCVEFPSLSWLAERPEASLDRIRKIVAEVVHDMRSKGESPPIPLSIKKFSVKFVMRIPPNVHRQLTIKAVEEDISLNRLISPKLTK